MENCPKVCLCYDFLSNASTEVRCRNQNLTEIPILIRSVTDLDFEGNALTKLSDNLSEYQSLRVVNLRRNRLQAIDQMYPLSLRVLNLDSNKLRRLNVNLVTPLTFNVTLSGNPWICDCDAMRLRKFLDQNKPRILDYANITCVHPIRVGDSDESLMTLIPPDMMCLPLKSEWNIIDGHRALILVASVAAFLSLYLLVITLYFRNEDLVAVFIYFHICPLCNSEPHGNYENDSKKIDGFLSYGAGHRHVATEVRHELESTDAETRNHREVPFKLCFHARDFIAGESIRWHIHNAVKSSHRTIIILSEGFIESPWFTVEFEAAYKNMLED